MIRNIIIGLDKFPMFDSDLFSQNNHGGLYVNLDPRSLKQILNDMISQQKVYLDPKDGNLYAFQYAISKK
jgi:hypothetical protein